MSEERQKTCAERVQNELKGRLIDLRILYGESTKAEQNHFLKYQGYDGEYNENELDDIWSEQRANYGLCFDYVAPETFKEQPEGFFRYQLSTGGPGDEFRFFVNPNFSVHRIEYWFLDWFDGANVVLEGKDYELLKSIFEDFKDIGSAQAEYERATE